MNPNDIKFLYTNATNEEVKLVENRENKHRFNIGFKEGVKIKDKGDIYYNLLIKSEETYNRYKNGKSKLHCVQGKRRSAEDIYRVCKFYFPEETTLKGVLKDLDKVIKPYGLGVYPVNCYTINRRTYKYIGSLPTKKEFKSLFYEQKDKNIPKTIS